MSQEADKKRVIVVHGWQGTPESHWKPWLKRKLEEAGFEVVTPQMPNPIFPALSEWTEFLREVVGPVDKNTFFVGHSLGSLAIVRFLAELKEGVAGGSVLVAGFLADIGEPDLESFYSTPAQIERAKDHCLKFVTIFSDNDKDVPMDKGLVLQKVLDAELVVEHNKGHFCQDDGVIELPSVFSSLIKMSI
jgi:uncharacterized protein